MTNKRKRPMKPAAADTPPMVEMPQIDTSNAPFHAPPDEPRVADPS